MQKLLTIMGKLSEILKLQMDLHMHFYLKLEK